MNKPMKVFEFSFEVEYGGGIMLIAAPSMDEAITFVNENFPSKPWQGRWEYSYEIQNLTANYESITMITEYTRIE
jgi:hypothetical protein